MAIKVEYQWCLEPIDKYGDIIDADYSDLGDPFSKVDEDHPFYFAINKWYCDTESGDAEREYIYLKKDGTFEVSLPKYVMKIIEPYLNEIINHKNFRETGE